MRAAWFGRCAPWSLLGQASAGKEVEAREAVAWQAPVGPSDDGIRGSMDASAPDERKTPVTCVLIFGRSERPGVRHQDRCATVCAQTSAGKAPPARSATKTDRAALRPSRREVVAGKQRRGRAAHPPHPCRRCGLPLRYFDPVSILPNFVLEPENLYLENQNIFFKQFEVLREEYSGRSTGVAFVRIFA